MTTEITPTISANLDSSTSRERCSSAVVGPLLNLGRQRNAMAAFTEIIAAIKSPKPTNSPIRVSNIVLKTSPKSNELYQSRSVQMLVKMANATTITAAMTRVGKIAPRGRRDMRRLLTWGNSLN